MSTSTERMEPSDHAEPSAHTRVRYAARGHYDAETIHSILDEAMFAHVGLIDRDRPVVIPMLHVRINDSLILHGSPATRFFRHLKTGPTICVTATLLDGLVLARSAFHHSLNYRSVVVFGEPAPIKDLEEKRAALDLLTDKLVPGRRSGLRPMTEKEVRGTSVLALPISEASAKVRSGPPVDEEDDYALPIWAGVVPAGIRYGAPVPDPRLHPDATTPEHLGFFTG